MAQALVTGATSGIGRAIAVALRQDGYEVTAIGRRRDSLEELSREHGIQGICTDLSDLARLTEALGDLAPDVLVNNAGVMPPLVEFCDSSQDEIERAILVNLSSVLAMTRLIVPGMRTRGRGHVFFTGSTAGHAPFSKLAVYCATKAAIGAFAQALRLELGAHQVRVTEIVAGRVETELYKDILSLEQREAMYAKQAAVQPRDVAAMLMAVLGMPKHVDVARFDILPTHQATTTGATQKKEN